MRARKRFGQHFLHDQGVLQQFAGALGLRANDRVLEIGPGHGALTDVLINQPQVYKAVEIDRDLVPLLRARYPQLEVINEDILRVDLSGVLDAGEPWRVIGNLPYNISSPLLAVLTGFLRSFPGRIADMHFMLQREMAERLTASPGTKANSRSSMPLTSRQRVSRRRRRCGPVSFACCLSRSYALTLTQRCSTGCCGWHFPGAVNVFPTPSRY